MLENQNKKEPLSGTEGILTYAIESVGGNCKGCHDASIIRDDYHADIAPACVSVTISPVSQPEPQPAGRPQTETPEPANLSVI